MRIVVATVEIHIIGVVSTDCQAAAGGVSQVNHISTRTTTRARDAADLTIGCKAAFGCRCRGPAWRSGPTRFSAHTASARTLLDASAGIHDLSACCVSRR